MLQDLVDDKEKAEGGLFQVMIPRASISPRVFHKLNSQTTLARNPACPSPLSMKSPRLSPEYMLKQPSGTCQMLHN
jgi:hypothetical protein